MGRTRIHRGFLVVVTAMVTLALAVAGTGCALNRGANDTEESVTGGFAPSKSSGYGYGSLGGAPVVTDEMVAPDAYTGVATRAGASDADAAREQLIIRSGSMRLRVDDIDDVVERIRSAVATFGGTIEDLQISTEDDQPIYRPLASEQGADVAPLGAYVTVRVPGDKLEQFSKRVASFGTVLRQSSSQSDVTQQHIDLAARLKNLRAEETRLRDFLKAAKDVKEMLLVEAELSRVRGEIESLQGQLDYLDRQIALATLSVELVKPAPVVRPEGTDWGFSDAVTNGIQGAAGAVLGIITVSIAALPFALIALVVWLIVRSVMRRHRRSRVAQAAVDTGPAAGTDE